MQRNWQDNTQGLVQNGLDQKPRADHEQPVSPVAVEVELHGHALGRARARARHEAEPCRMDPRAGQQQLSEASSA